MEFLINTLEGNRDAFFDPLGSRFDVFGGATDDETHEVGNGGEEEIFGILLLCGPFEEFVQEFRTQGTLDGEPRHDAQGRLLDEGLEQCGHQHDRLLTNPA